MSVRKDNSFWNNLYMGLAYEHYTVVALWSMGYEAFKIDADFGFDILAYNQKERTFSNGKGRDLSPYVFQVKSRHVKGWETKEQLAGERKSTQVEFRIRKEYWKRMLEEDKSYLVCYFVEEKKDAMDEICGILWLSSYQLNRLEEYFFACDEEDRNVVVKLEINTSAGTKGRCQEFMKEIEEKYEDIADFKEWKKLKRWIDKSSMINNNSESYMKLIDINGKKKMIQPSQYNFNNFDDEKCYKHSPLERNGDEEVWH